MSFDNFSRIKVKKQLIASRNLKKETFIKKKYKELKAKSEFPGHKTNMARVQMRA